MKFTLVIVSLMILVFLYELSLPSPDEFFDTYGFSGENMLSRPYVLITSIFLHAGLAHLLSNILAMMFFSSAVESELGAGRTLVVFTLGAMAGDLFSLAFYPFNAIAVGASAGVFALIGAGILVKPTDISFYPFIMPLPLALIGMSYVIYNIYGLFFDATSNISYAGHFGGMLVGIVFGFRREGFGKSMKIIMLSIIGLILIALMLSLLRNAVV